uniref:Prostaglandin-H2 D-isomerase n=1 Tax=Geotrypetes seraphini TaxID=260995 RepID=A0A6P8SM56_GEOSA|nr:lipocalin-1-like [Geotrypetes seraphini]
MPSILALSVGLLLSCVLQAWALPTPMKDFDETQFLGGWIQIASATADKQQQDVMKEMSMPHLNFQIQGETFILKIGYNIAGKCNQQTIMLKQMGQPGVWSYKSDGIECMMGVVYTDYNNYAIMMRMDNGHIIPVLLARTSETNSEYLSKFEEEIRTMDLSANDIVTPVYDDKCVPE